MEQRISVTPSDNFKRYGYVVVAKQQQQRRLQLIDKGRYHSFARESWILHKTGVQTAVTFDEKQMALSGDQDRDCKRVTTKHLFSYRLSRNVIITMCHIFSRLSLDT